MKDLDRVKGGALLEDAPVPVRVFAAGVMLGASIVLAAFWTFSKLAEEN